MDFSKEFIIDKAINTYKLVKEELRFDGEYINHFASLIFADEIYDIDIKKIKEIRKYIKNNTKSLKSFRGEMLYIISIMISREENYLGFCDKVIEINETLKEEGFKSSPYLVLSSYSIVKRSSKSQYGRIMTNLKVIYSLLKNEFKNITTEEDYLICALLAIKSVKENDNPEDAGLFVESMFNYLLDLENYSRNDLQLISTGLLLNSSASAQYEIKNLINTFKENDMRIGDEVLNIVSVIPKEKEIIDYVNSVKEIVEYLCEEGEYAFFMDKDFRVMLAIVIEELYERRTKIFPNKYLKELLALSIYSFISRKKQNIFEEVLA